MNTVLLFTHMLRGFWMEPGVWRSPVWETLPLPPFLFFCNTPHEDEETEGPSSAGNFS